MFYAHIQELLNINNKAVVEYTDGEGVFQKGYTLYLLDRRKLSNNLKPIVTHVNNMLGK